MIDRQHGEIIFSCDDCDDTMETGEDDFHVALAIVKREGWTVRQVSGEWLHRCPSCVRTELRRAF